MRNNPGYHRKGSVIVMVVGLLVMLAMIGTTFIIIASMDRKEARSIATAAPMKHVAGGVLQQILAKLPKDLYIDDKGTPDPSDDVIYGSAADYKQQSDYPHEDYDKHLASYGPVDVGGGPVWLHLSNLTGDLAEAGNRIGTDGVISIGVYATENITTLTDAGGNAYGWVDTDGDGVKDAISYFSGVTNRAGQKYYVAVRLIDASGLMNANSAYSTSAAAGGTVMPITNIALNVLTDDTTRNNVHDARNGSTFDNIATFNTNCVRRPLNPVVDTYRLFEVSDTLALSWGGTFPPTASGRLWEALGGQFGSAKPYLTVHSASRDYVRRYTGIQDTTHRVNLNSAGFVDLFKAFYNAIPEGIAGFTPDNPARKMVAAQLAANVIDYRDSGDVPYQPAAADMTTVGLAGVTIFGVERQPFITEAWLRMEWDAAVPPGSVKQKSAIELFNPYKTAISLAGYKLKVDTNTYDMSTLPANIPAGGRIVIVSSPVAEIRALFKIQDTHLDLMKTCTLLRETSVPGGYAPVGSVDISEFGLDTPDAGVPAAVHARIRRDDTVSRAKYSVAVYASPENYTYLIGDPGCPNDAGTNLGRSNSDVDLGAAVVPTPVFVRNGNLINLGDVLRIFYVGPTSSDVPLDKTLALSPTNISNGRLNTLGAIKPPTGPVDPQQIQIPPACMLGDYMDVLVPDPLNTGRTDTVYGRININTAPWQVIQYLPGIASLPTLAQRELVAKDIVAYRDLLNNTAAGGQDYSIADARATVLGLADLRADAGFGSPGEVAIPLARVVTPRPNNIYNTVAPNCYKVADSNTSDDGLSAAPADNITGDLSKYDIYYSWLSNQVTVRSDVYIAYIRVQIGSGAATTGAVRRYVAVIDRSNCTSATDLPNVLMFAPLK